MSQVPKGIVSQVKEETQNVYQYKPYGMLISLKPRWQHPAAATQPYYKIFLLPNNTLWSDPLMPYDVQRLQLNRSLRLNRFSGTCPKNKVFPIRLIGYRSILLLSKNGRVFGRLPDYTIIAPNCTMYIQCPLDIQTSLRHQGRGRYRQRGRFIKRLDIATWRPL